MKKLICLIFLTAPVLGTTQKRNKKNAKKYEDFMNSISMVSTDIGAVSGVLTNDFSRFPSSFKLDPSKSKSFSLNFMKNTAEDKDQLLSYTLGLGAELRYYHLLNNSNLTFNDDVTTISEEIDNSYTKNRLKLIYIQTPILIRFNKEIKYRYYQLSTGIIPGLKLYGKYKQKYRVDNQIYKVKTSGHFNLNPFKLDATIRIGRGKIGAFFNYSLLTLFEKDKHEQLMPYSVGFTVNGF